MDINVLYLDGTESVFEGVTDFYDSPHFENFIELEMDDFSRALIRKEYVPELYTAPDGDDLDVEDQTYGHWNSLDVNQENFTAESGMDE